MPEEERNIDVRIEKWVEAKLKGNYRCPHCGRIMIVIGGFENYAYCPNCERYFVPERQRIDFQGGMADERS